MSEEKKNAATEEVKEARQLTEEELENVNGGVAPISGDDAAGISKGYKLVFRK